MYRVLNCLTDEHDLRLVVLAVAVCLLASLVAIRLWRQATAVSGRARLTWLALAGVAGGCGIWATHFIAMLAYEPHVPVAYDIELTAGSLLIAIVFTFAALAFATFSQWRLAAPLGGAIFGLGVAAMHYAGMFALEVPGVIGWLDQLVAASIALGVVIGAVALTVAARYRGIGGTIAAAVLLTVTIASLHFTSMGAAVLIPNAGWAMPSMALDETWLAVVVAVAAIAVLSISLLGAAADSRLSRRRQQFDRARQELIEESERKLRQQNIRLDAALNNMSQGLCMFDANERIVVFNRRFLEMYRLSPEVVRPGCTFRELIEHRKQVGLLDADPETYYRAVLDDMAKGHSKHWITQNRDGRVIEARNERMPDGGWVTTHEDVTDHHRAEAQVREQKFQLDAALNNMIQGLLMFDAEGRLILCNRRFLDIYGLTGDEFTIGTATLDQLIRLVAPMRKNPPEAASHARRVIDGVASGQPVTLLTELVDGRFIAIANHPISDGRWVTTHENITDRHNAEALLRERTLELDAALENMVQGLCTFDKDGRLTLVNRRYSEMYGLGAKAIQPGMTLIEMLEQRRAVGSFSGDAAQYVAELHAGLKRGENFTAVTRTGSGRIVSVANHAMSDGRWVSTHDDITDRQQAAELLRGQKVQLDTALNNMSQGLNTFDAEGRLVLCNQRYLEMYRLSPDVVKPGCTVQDIVQARAAAGTFFRTDPDVYTGDLLDSMSRRQPAEQILETVDGRVVAVNSQPMPDGTGWVVTHEDITGRRRAEEERDRSRAFASTVIENVPATITVKDVQDLRYVLVNRAAEQQFGLPRQEIIGRVAEDIFPPDISASITAHDREMLRLNAPSIVDEHPVKLPRGGDVRFISSSRTPIRDQNGKIEYILSVVEDRTQRRRAEAQIAHMAHHDALTGLPNRAAFNECLNASIEASAKDNSFFALLSLDSDRFKEINDVFGHAIGDKLLCEIAKRVQETAGGAFVARQSADEFSVITTDGSQPAAAEELADRIIAAIGQGFTIDGNQIRISISIGVAIYPADGNDVTTLNANADAALYRAKSEGRGGYRFFEADMDRRLRDRRILQQDLQSAIARSELTLHYQPQAKLNGEVIGFEALVRWHHPLRGMVPPGSFIPLAEDSGLIVTLGEWILREACREAASWPKPLHIAINLSPVQFRHGDLVALVHSVLLETGLSPSRIEFEITEGVLIGDFSRAVSILRQLKALGVRIAMDDFGTGYSSLSYLQAFPFDKIKIDQGFISNLERNQQSATIVRAVIGLARGLALPVVAEGVETKEQLAFLAKESCDQVQGYLIGRPRPIADYAEMVGRRPSQRKLTLVAS